MTVDIEILLDVILHDIIPITKKNSLKGNKIFGAAIGQMSDLGTLAIGANNEILNPLFHGEISALNNFFKEKNNILTSDCVFLSTHEPCSLCLSAITWAGFNNFYYFFPYEDTKNKFNIPHDLNILKEVFNIEKGNYNNSNSYWESFAILDEISCLDNEKKQILNFKKDNIIRIYEILSKQYQLTKFNSKIPLN
jgi:tRNA(Arg) A34 adenosine deaminase TadA